MTDVEKALRYEVTELRERVKHLEDILQVKMPLLGAAVLRNEVIIETLQECNLIDSKFEQRCEQRYLQKLRKKDNESLGLN